MKQSEARRYMEQAIDVMQRSVPELRDDGKASPLVGAVLVDTGKRANASGRVTAACRGELREGDHAEYTLLERKCRDRDLTGCILFATLEPCAPASRKPPKRGCAERIVLSRIKEVWIGIEDPDPTVDRKGIKYLQDHGVKVNMFDRDLQEVIREKNQEFIEQALERAAAAEEIPEDVVLSPLESIVGNPEIEELSIAALQEYRSQTKVSEAVDSDAFKCRLVRQNLLQLEGGRFVPTGFGMLLFGSEPRLSMLQAGLLATIHYPDGTEETKDFDGPQVLVPQGLLTWLKGKLPNVIDRSQAIRGMKNDALFELVREGVVNALVHRDYSIEEAKCQIRVSRDKIEILSPGQPVSPITIAQMQSFGAPMLSRNPLLHYVFAKMAMAEERGLGLKSMRQRAQEAGLPLPRYAWMDPYLVLTVYPTLSATTTSLAPGVLANLSDREQTGWQWVSTKGRTGSTDYADALKIDVRTARRHLNHFVELGLMRPVGSGPATEYEIV